MKRLLLIVILLVLAGCTATREVHITDIPPWYSPSVLNVSVGDTVVWDNGMAAVVHPVNILDGPEKFSSGHFTKTWERTFTEPGVYHYFCPIHPYMQGFIAVDAEVDPAKIPYWLSWPPAAAEKQVPGPVPATPGVGEVWLDAQFQKVLGKSKPGAIIVVDASMWGVTQVINDQRLNNPHNMWLSDDGAFVIQTNWFDKYVSIIDAKTKEIVRHVYVGESPAHVMTANGLAYVTVQGDDGIVILNGTTFEKTKTFRTVGGEHAHGDEHSELGRGPHGNWLSMDGMRMAVAHTEGGGISIWDAVAMEKLWEQAIDPLPLMAGISDDGMFAWVASFATGRFTAYDVGTQEVIADFIVGKNPVQSIPSPDGKYITVALSGDGAAAIIDAHTFKLIKTLPSGAGAHGVYYGPKQGGGWYAYVSNKFVTWITVIDMDALEIAGYIPLPKESLGGQGILAVYE